MNKVFQKLRRIISCKIHPQEFPLILYILGKTFLKPFKGICGEERKIQMNYRIRLEVIIGLTLYIESLE